MEPIPGLHPEYLFADVDSDALTHASEPVEPQLSEQHPQIVLLNDFVRNVGLLMSHIDMEQQYDIPLEQSTLDQILSSDIEDALTESLGTKTYGDTVGNEIKPEVLVYESFVRTLIREVLKNDDKEFQKAELQKIIKETSSFREVGDIPSRQDLLNRIEAIKDLDRRAKEIKKAQELINTTPESSSDNVLAA
jgi:hypothetical protein